MKDDSKKKKVIPVQGQVRKVKKVDPKEQLEQEQLFVESDKISPVNKKIDKKEIVKTVGGEEINISDYIAETYAGKSTHFFPSFYNLIADLLGVSHEVMKQFVKPLIVPQLKRAFIYGRLPFLVQQRLYQKNPYTGYCTRDQFNYQWLTKDADVVLRGYIKDFEDEGKKILLSGGNMQDFIAHFGAKFNLSFQIDMFEGK